MKDKKESEGKKEIRIVDLSVDEALRASYIKSIKLVA